MPATHPMVDLLIENSGWAPCGVVVTPGPVRYSSARISPLWSTRNASVQVSARTVATVAVPAAVTGVRGS